MATPAEQLNDKWDALSSLMNNYPQIPRTTSDKISKAISDWQDWYYSDTNYGKWGDISEWSVNYTNVLAFFQRAIKTKKPQKPIVTTPTTVTRVMEPLMVTAKPPADYTWWIIAGVAVLIIGSVMYFDKKPHHAET